MIPPARTQAISLFCTLLFAAPGAFALGLSVDLSTGADTPESALSQSLDTLCPQLKALSTPDADQSALIALCDALADANLDEGQKEAALRAASARAASAETTAASYLPSGATLLAAGNQFAALRRETERLAAIQRWRDNKIPLRLAAADNVASDAGEAGGDSRLGSFISISRATFTQDETPWITGMDGNGNGLALGLDYRFGQRLFSGAAFNYASHDADLDGGGTLSATSDGLTLYTNYGLSDSTELSAVLAWGQQAYELNRQIAFTLGGLTVNETAASKPKGSNLGLSLSGAWQKAFGGTGLNLTGTLYLAQQTIDEFRENGGHGYALQVDAQKINTTRLNINAMLQHTFSTAAGVITPQLALTWLHEFNTDGQDITAHFLVDSNANTFTYNTQERDADYLQAAFGVPVMFADGFSAFLQYESVLGLKDFSQNTLTLGARLEF